MDEWKIAPHAKARMLRRNIPAKCLNEGLDTPDFITEDRQYRVYHKVKEGRLIRIVTEGNVILTVYITSKVNKYLKERK